MDFWDGKVLKDFDLGILPDFREITAFKLATSDLNKVDLEKIAAQ